MNKKVESHITKSHRVLTIEASHPPKEEDGDQRKSHKNYKEGQETLRDGYMDKKLKMEYFEKL